MIDASPLKRRVYKVVIYFQDSPTPLELSNVWHIQTEGGLLRMIINGNSQWWPLCNIANIRELGRHSELIEKKE
jgi:hypothetical protein